MSPTPPTSLRSCVLVLASMAMLAMIATDIYLPSMPSIVADLHTTHGLLQLTLSLFMLGTAAGQLFYGAMLDHVGRRSVLCWSMGLYLAASVVCSFADSVLVLIIFRVIQAFGASGSIVIAFAAPRDIENEVERSKLMSYITMSVSISPIFAPILGALLQETFGWRSNFIAMLLIGVGVFALAYFKLSEIKNFVATPCTLKSATIRYTAVLKNAYFWCYSLCAALAFTAAMCFILNSSYILMDVVKLNPQQFALLFASNALMLILGGFLGIRLRKRFDVDQNIKIGAALIFLGSLVILLRIAFASISVWVILPIFVVTLGAILIMPAANARALSPFPRSAGSAAAVTNSLRMVIASLISAAVGFLVTYSFASWCWAMMLCAVAIFVVLALKNALGLIPDVVSNV